MRTRRSGPRGYDEDGNGEPDVTETQYTVTARVEGEGGSIDPTSKTVNAGEDVEFTIDAKDGYALDTIQVNSKTEYTNDDITAPFEGIWTLENVQEAAEVVVTFGEDENGNGVPDDKEEPEEEQYTVTGLLGQRGAGLHRSHRGDRRRRR